MKALAKKQYLNTFLANQLSKNTRIAYRGDLKQFGDWLAGKYQIDNPEEVTIDHIIEYRERLSSKHKPLTANRKITTVKALFSFLRDIGLLLHDPAASVKGIKFVDESPTLGLTDDEVKMLLNAPDEATETGRMHKTMLYLLAFCGIRRGELLGLKLGDIIDQGGVPVITVLGKGNKKRSIPLPEPALKMLNNYLGFITQKEYGEYLFENKGKPLNPSTINWIVKKYATEIGIQKKGISPHSLRATCASNARENGASEKSLMQTFGWKSNRMVERYDKRKLVLEKSANLKVSYGEK